MSAAEARGETAEAADTVRLVRKIKAPAEKVFDAFLD